jgi:transcription termination factor Rho
MQPTKGGESFAEEVGVENASTMRKQELMFAILKQLAANETEIIGAGTVEVLQDGFGFLRSHDSNYLPGPDDIYISPTQIRRREIALAVLGAADRALDGVAGA